MLYLKDYENLSLRLLRSKNFGDELLLLKIIEDILKIIPYAEFLSGL